MAGGLSKRRFLRSFVQQDFSGGVQTSTTRLLQRRNELDAAKNATFNKKIGGAARRDGYEQVGRTIQDGNDGLAGFVYKYFRNNKIMVGINNQANSAATIQYLDVNNYWSTVGSLPSIAPNTKMYPINFLDESYWVGRAPDSDTYMSMINIDSSLNVSTTRNVLNAPLAEFIAEFQGRLYAINVSIGGVKYPDRAYLSSPATGAITFVQGDQVGLLQQLSVDTVRYLKPGMTIDIYSAGTNSKQITALTIVSVNKALNIITFAATQINLKDNDEIYLTGRKGQLSVLWNTDYPTPESADYLRVPPSKDETSRFTGWGQNNSRLFLFTKNAMFKWDGANLITVSDTIGCVSHATIKNIGPWTVWLHNSGVWAYNDSTGQLQLLSRGWQNYIQAINQSNLSKASAIVVGRVYKLAVGEIADLDSITTSTSTSSTSTSSTSSSTSSTSTSSTSTSSTSSSTSTTTVASTSTSTSSTSTSSTSTSVSTSSTSTSFSTSSTSTSTTTVVGGKQVVRLIYDFDMNAFWPEYHRREFRAQFLHTMSGYTKPYFLDETGRLWRDETTNSDGNDTIPFEIETGSNNFGLDQMKEYDGCYIQSDKATNAQVNVSLDDGEWQSVGQVNSTVQYIQFPAWVRGRNINYRITHNDPGDSPIIDSITTEYLITETSPG